MLHNLERFSGVDVNQLADCLGGDKVTVLVNQVAEANGMKIMDSLNNAENNNVQIGNNNEVNSNLQFNK
jgi:hypothetical protein